MDANFLTDQTNPALPRAVKANLYAFLGTFRGSPLAEVLERPGFYRWRTAIPHPWFSGALSSDPPDAQAAHMIQETLAFFRQQRVPSCTWWLAPELPAMDWGRLLKAHGYHFSSDVPGMAMDLSKLEQLPLQPGNLEIRLVEDEVVLRTWAGTFMRGYGLPVAWAAPFGDLLVSLGLDLPFQHYLGYLDDQPVATATLFEGAGVAGIYDVATLPEQRGQGLGAALTTLPLLEARQRGHLIGVLQSSPMGYPVYRRMGFEQVCSMDHFYIEPGRPS